MQGLGLTLQVLTTLSDKHNYVVLSSVSAYCQIWLYGNLGIQLVGGLPVDLDFFPKCTRFCGCLTTSECHVEIAVPNGLSCAIKTSAISFLV